MRRSVVALALVPFLLSACGGDDAQPARTPDRAPTTSMTYYPSPTATPGTGTSRTITSAAPSPVSTTASLPEPVMPAAAKANTPDGAAAFARYYIDVVNYAWQKPDPVAVTKVADATCTTCSSWAKTAADMAASARRVDRAPMVVSQSAPAHRLETGEQVVITVVNQEAFRRIEKNGQSSPLTSPGTLRLQWFLLHGPSGWRVAAIETVS